VRITNRSEECSGIGALDREERSGVTGARMRNQEVRLAYGGGGDGWRANSAAGRIHQRLSLSLRSGNGIGGVVF